MDPKLYMKFSYFEIQNFPIIWTNLDGVNKTKLVYIDEIYNFVGDAFFI
jgi:hypothetical protein